MLWDQGSSLKPHAQNVNKAAPSLPLCRITHQLHWPKLLVKHVASLTFITCGQVELPARTGEARWATTYLGPELRIGRAGSSGNVFVFRRTAQT